MRPNALPEDFDEVRHHWGWFLVLGIVLITIGIVALGSVLLATLASVLFLGWLLIVSGAFEVITSFWARRWSGLLLQLLIGVLQVVVGVLLATRPLVSAAALTLVLATLFLTSGLFRSVAAAVIRHPAWGWGVLDGLLSLFLGFLIWSEWPNSSLWVMGTFLGVGLMFRGWAWVMFAFAARHAGEADVFGHPQRA